MASTRLLEDDAIAPTGYKTFPDAASQSTKMLDDVLEIPADSSNAQDMEKKFSLWSVLGIGFSLTNSWFGVSAALVTGLDSGGPVLLVYGIILIFLVSLCVGISLSELASAMPNAGGQYYWSHRLAPPKYARLASFLVGWISWAGSIFTSASVSLAMGYATVGCYQLSHPDFEVKPWHVFFAYQLINAVVFCFNCYGKILPIIGTCTLYCSIIAFVIIFITVPASAPTHRPASFVFATFINNTGWTSNGIAFAIGLMNPNWAFACLDCATHLAEEVPKPQKVIPTAIMGTIGIGFVTAWLYVVSMFFSINGSFESVRDSPTGVPILELFNQALENRAGAIVLESLIILTGMGSLNAAHTWQSRLCWSFARDGGLPLSELVSQINPILDVPLYAHMFSCIVVALVGFLFLLSRTAFNSMVTACIVLLYISYSVPVIFLLLKGRENIKQGPFWMGTLGLVANYGLLAWTLFTLMIYSLPVRLPVRIGNMNYVSVVYTAVLIILTTDWYLRGRHHFRKYQQKKSKSQPRDSIRRRFSTAVGHE